MRHYSLIPVRYNDQLLLVRCEPVDAELWSIQWQAVTTDGNIRDADTSRHWFADCSPLERGVAVCIVQWLNDLEGETHERMDRRPLRTRHHLPLVRGLYEIRATRHREVDDNPTIPLREAMMDKTQEIRDSLAWIVEFCHEHAEWFGAEDGAEGEWLANATELLKVSP